MCLCVGVTGSMHVCDVCGGAVNVLLYIASDILVDDLVVADTVVVTIGACDTVVGLRVVDANAVGTVDI